MPFVIVYLVSIKTNEDFCLKTLYHVYMIVFVPILPYSDKRKQLLKMTFLAN